MIGRSMEVSCGSVPHYSTPSARKPALRGPDYLSNVYRWESAARTTMLKSTSMQEGQNSENDLRRSDRS